MPPPVGGIATIVSKLASDPAVAPHFDFFDVTKRGQGFVQLYLVRPLRQLRELNRRLSRRPPAIVAFSSAYGSFWERCVWLWLARRHRVPMLVMMVDGRFGEFYAALPRWRQKLARRALENFHTVIVQSESWRRFYRGLAPQANCAILPNGVDCDEFTPAPRAGNPRLVVLMVGWLTPEKGVFDLLDAVKLMEGAGDRFVVRLVGPWHGNEAAIRARIAEHGIAKAIELVGPLNGRGEILREYQQADLFTLPSWAEGLPVSVLEAMGCALPIVATNVGGVPDLVSADCGALVPPRAPADLARELARYLGDPALRLASGQAARARVSEHFSTQKFGPGLLRLVEATR